jgi:potassium efflux system protein
MNTVNPSLTLVGARLAALVIGLAAWASAAGAAPPPSNAVPASAVAAAPPPVAAPKSAPTAAPAIAPPPAPPELPVTLSAEQATLTELGNQAAIASNDARLASLGAEASSIEAQARAEAAGPAAQIATINRELAKLTPRRRHAAPTAAEKAKAAPLLAERASLTSEETQADAIANSARAAFSEIAERRREGFSARVLTQSASPLSPDFWTDLADAADSDGQRLVMMAQESIDTAVDAEQPRAAIGLIVGLAVALALLFPARIFLGRLGRRKTGEAVSAGSSKTGAALWVAAVDTATPAFAVAALRTGAQSGGLLSPEADALAGSMVVAVAWAAGILALGRVLATDRDASQRLLPLPDDVGKRVRLPLRTVALITGVGFMLTKLNYVVGASVAATIAFNCGISLAYAAAALLVLVSFGRGAAPTEPAERRAAPVWTLISLILVGAIVVTLGAILAGYTTLAALVSGQIFWLSLIAGAAYLVMRFIDDLTAGVFSPKGWASRTLFLLFRFRRSTIGQAGALISAAAQIIVLIAALSLALTPFGRGGDLLVSHIGELGRPIRFGSATISPMAIAAGIATLMIGMGLARGVQDWVVKRYLPVTDWDAGVRNSVTTGVGYLGVGIALMCALAATGLGFAQIALVASALSVGIGFGLQNVVQNFVSGVILLVERPVKVGDWVTIDGVEGGIRRIRVRATEIELSDRSTVIVPNSDLITKPVRNKTLGDHYAGVSVRLSVNKAADAEKARELLLDVVRGKSAQAGGLNPWVNLDSLAVGGAANLTCGFYIEDPRGAGKARSDVYFAIIDALGGAEIGFAGPIDPA